MLIFLFALLARLLLNTDGGSDEGDPGDGDGDSGGNGDSSDGREGGTPPEEIRDPKAKAEALQDRVNRLHRRLKEKDDAIAKLTADLEARPPGDHLRSALLEIAFLKHVMSHEQRIVDIPTAWELGTTKGYFDPVKDDGEGMDQALTKLLERYPYLVSEDGDEPSASPTLPSTRPMNSGRRSSAAHEDRTFQQRFPAMRGRR
jgi:hypothetical protein